MIETHSNSNLNEKQETLRYTKYDNTIVILNIVKGLKFSL